MKDQSFFERLNNWIRNSITIKLISIGILILIMLIPASMIESLIREREYTMDNAFTEVSSKWGYAQTITGPILSVPYRSFQKTEKGGVVEIINYAHFLPDKLDIKAKLNPEMRYRGIYEVVVYNSKLNFSGNFSSVKLKDWNIPDNMINWKDAFVSIGIPDMRGIENKVGLKWNDKELFLNPGIDSKDIIASGISVKIPLSANDSSQIFNYSFDITLKGSGDLNFIPLGKETNVQLESNWKTPSFDGSFLPDQREINTKGFKANWNILHLNRNYPQQWRNSEYKVDDSQFGVKLLVPVDEYQKTTRSAKYAVMIIALTFLLFFFSEVLNKKRIHPIQYLLVGIALCVFYTLLLSLSEHINFNLAYIVSSAAIIILITVYSLSIFKNKKMSALMCLILAILYAFVFTILQLEDYALLMGSIGLFIVLAVIMHLSRKINWYSINQEETSKEI